MKFDLNARIRKIKEEGTIEPRAVADKVLAQIPEEEYEDVLRYLLPPHVTTIYSQMRTRQNHRSSEQSPETGYRDDGAYVPGGFVSNKVRQVHESWQARLQDPVRTEDGWKLLGEFTWQDLRYAAEDREKRADEMKYWSRYFNELRGLLTTYDVEMVDELPTHVKRTFFEKHSTSARAS